MANIEAQVNNTLDRLDNDKDGFFLMYEKAHIDKHCHNNDINNIHLAVIRFNQMVIGNIQIPQTIASFMGEDNFGDQSEYGALTK